jgi:hypothetical protein
MLKLRAKQINKQIKDKGYIMTTNTNKELEIAKEVNGSIEPIEQLPISIEGKIDLTKELELLEPEIIQSSLRVEENNNKTKLFIGENRINIYTSKRGFKYFLLDGKTYIKGGLRSAIMNHIYNLTEPTLIGKLGKYEILVGSWNNKEFYFWLNIQSQRVEFISNLDAVKNSATTIEYNKLKEEMNNKSHFEPIVEAESEIYGSSEASLGYLAVERVIDELERAKEVIAQAKQFTHYEVRELLDEIGDLIS